MRKMSNLGTLLANTEINISKGKKNFIPIENAKFSTSGLFSSKGAQCYAHEVLGKELNKKSAFNMRFKPNPDIYDIVSVLETRVLDKICVDKKYLESLRIKRRNIKNNKLFTQSEIREEVRKRMKSTIRYGQLSMRFRRIKKTPENFDTLATNETDIITLTNDNIQEFARPGIYNVEFSVSGVWFSRGTWMLLIDIISLSPVNQNTVKSELEREAQILLDILSDDSI